MMSEVLRETKACIAGVRWTTRLVSLGGLQLAHRKVHVRILILCQELSIKVLL